MRRLVLGAAACVRWHSFATHAGIQVRRRKPPHSRQMQQSDRRVRHSHAEATSDARRSATWRAWEWDMEDGGWSRSAYVLSW